MTGLPDPVAATMPISRPVPRDGAPPPDGHHYIAVQADKHWAVLRPPRGRCRFLMNRHGCGEVAVAQLWRPHHRGRRAGTWWLYCPQHLFGRWIEDGQVMQWIVQLDQEADS